MSLESDYAEKLTRIETFYADLRHFQELLPDTNKEHIQQDVPSAADPLRLDLIRRSGFVRQLSDRILGIPSYEMFGRRDDLWNIVLFDSGVWNRKVMAGHLADLILRLIGTLEADPQLFDPRPIKMATPTASSTGQITVYGGVVNLAQGITGSVRQSASLEAAEERVAEELREQLTQLRAAIEDLDAPESERGELLKTVSDAEAATANHSKTPGGFLRHLGALKILTQVDAAWKGWDRVVSAAGQAAAKAQELVALLPPGANGQ